MGRSPDVFTVFYCWQSDTPQSHARYLIREALEQASDRLSSDTSLPFKIEIDSDTSNETGMCDIPATILKKLEKADAIVADLTFIAKSEKGKHCSNPNVLFELGYAFHSIGAERLICVINEKHGPRTEQIFDLAHRRHPVPFESPADAMSRDDVVKRLSKDLEAALRPIIKLGLSGGFGGDDQRRHEAERVQIEAFWDSQPRSAGAATISLSFRPSRYREGRWQDARTLEEVVERRAVQNGIVGFPPRQVGTAPMEWGIYNDQYRDPWAVTCAGQLWLGEAVIGSKRCEVDSFDVGYHHDVPKPRTLNPVEWIPISAIAAFFENAFNFAASLSNEFNDGELFEWSAVGRDLSGKWLGVGRMGGPSNLFGPCRANGFSIKENSTVAEFKARRFEHCLNWACEACNKFVRDGRYLTPETMKFWMHSQ